MVKDGVVSVVTGIAELPEKIMRGIKDLLELLFVPTKSPFDEIAKKFNEKFAFFRQIKTMLSTAIKTGDGSTPPVFEFELFGHKLSLIDFSFFSPYRLFVHGIIIAIFWFKFLQWLLVQVRFILQPGGGN